MSLDIWTVAEVAKIVLKLLACYIWAIVFMTTIHSQPDPAIKSLLDGIKLFTFFTTSTLSAGVKKGYSPFEPCTTYPEMQLIMVTFCWQQGTMKGVLVLTSKTGWVLIALRRIGTDIPFQNMTSATTLIFERIICLKTIKSLWCLLNLPISLVLYELTSFYFTTIWPYNNLSRLWLKELAFRSLLWNYQSGILYWLSKDCVFRARGISFHAACTPLCKLIETNIKNTKNLVFFLIFYSMNISVHILVHNMTTAIIKKYFDAFGHWVDQFWTII